MSSSHSTEGTQIRRCGVCVLELDDHIPPLRISKGILEILKAGSIFSEVDLALPSKNIISSSLFIGPHNLSTLKASAKRGCTGCQCLQELIFRNITDVRVLRNKNIEIDWRQSYYTSKNHISIRIKEDSDDIMKFEMFSPDSEIADNKFIKCAPEIFNTASSAALGRLNSWLGECVSSHPLCASTPVARLPKRVLQITKHTDAYNLRLIDSDSIFDRYVCLSHCWGTSRPACSTTNQTIQRNKEDIPWSSLPKTFQEAVIMTSQLGFRFLWIDSICIIQDSREDWLHEGGQMNSIYQNAFVTLAATKSADSSGGLFAEIPKRYDAIRIPQKRTNTPIFLRECLPHPKYTVSNRSVTEFYDDLDGKETYSTIGAITSNQSFATVFPLLTRAWVYQERLLSKRIIHFTATEILFECLSHTICECHPEDTAIDSVKHLHYTSIHEELASEMQLDFDQRWRELVVSYTGLHLTMEEDKLPALSGLAKEFADAHAGKMGKYVAGLWEKTIHRDLLWFCSEPTTPRPSIWRGPSWSWVSTNSQVGYYFENKPWQDVTFSEVISVPMRGGNYGICQSAHLMMSAYLIPGQLKRVDKRYLMKVDNHASKSKSTKRGFYLAVEISPDFEFDKPGDDRIAEDTAIFCIKRCAMGDPLAYCLVILPVRGETGSFRRIGITGDIDFRAPTMDERWTKHAALTSFKLV